MFQRVPLTDEVPPRPGHVGSRVKMLIGLAGLVSLVAIATLGYYHDNSKGQQSHETNLSGSLARYASKPNVTVNDKVTSNASSLQGHSECDGNCSNKNPCFPHCAIPHNLRNPEEDPSFDKMRSAERLEQKSHVDQTKPADKLVYTGGSTRMFLNIPYAVQPYSSATNFEYASPIKAPAKKLKQKNREFGPPCPQYLDKSMARSTVGTFQCLHLNVFAPLYAPTNGSLPVLVMFHGGQLVRGAASELGVNGLAGTFVRRGVVVVTANYRLGAIGFYKFATRDKILETLGKNRTIDELRGLHDQLLVLKYVHDNIHHYNGDPSRVTVAGHDGSACTVAYLALVASAHPMHEFFGTPLTDLFERVIMMSGAIGTCISYVDSPSKDYNDSRCVGELGPEQTRAKAWEYNCLVERQSDSQGYVNSYSHRFPLNWKLEPPFGDMFLHPSVLNAKALAESKNGTEQQRRKSILMGYASHDATELYNMFNNTMSEGLFYEAIGFDIYNFSMLQKLIANVTHERNYHGLAVNASTDKNIMNSTKLVNDLKKRYLKRFNLNAEPSMHNSTMDDTRWKMFFLALTEGFYTVPLLNDARSFSSIGHDVYMYKFDTKPPIEFLDGITVPQYVYITRASSSDPHVVPFGTEMPYLFKQERYWMTKMMLIKKNEMLQHQKTTDDMADMWVNFIYYGYPLRATGDRFNSPRDMGRFTCDAYTDPTDCASFVQDAIIQIGKSDKEYNPSDKVYGHNSRLYLVRGNYITRGVETAWRKWGNLCDSNSIKAGNCTVHLHYNDDDRSKTFDGPRVPVADSQATASAIAIVHAATSPTPGESNESTTSTANATGEPPASLTDSTDSFMSTVSTSEQPSLTPSSLEVGQTTANTEASSEPPTPPAGLDDAIGTTHAVDELTGTKEESLVTTRSVSAEPPASPTGENETTTGTGSASEGPPASPTGEKETTVSNGSVSAKPAISPTGDKETTVSNGSVSAKPAIPPTGEKETSTGTGGASEGPPVSLAGKNEPTVSNGSASASEGPPISS